MSYRKVGGLHFVKLGRFGFSFYRSRRFNAAALRVAWARDFLTRLE